MKNVKRAFVLLVAILAIVVFTQNVNATAISTNKTNNTTNNTTNTANNTTNTANNTVANETPEETEPAGPVNNAYQPITPSNSNEDIPHTGIEDSYFNFALILLLTLTLGTFSLVQYNKIIKKDNEEQ